MSDYDTNSHLTRFVFYCCIRMIFLIYTFQSQNKMMLISKLSYVSLVLEKNDLVVFNIEHTNKGQKQRNPRTRIVLIPLKRHRRLVMTESFRWDPSTLTTRPGLITQFFGTFWWKEAFISSSCHYAANRNAGGAAAPPPDCESHYTCRHTLITSSAAKMNRFHHTG